MDPSDAITILILIILILLSSFFSSAETCMTAANRIKLKSLADSGSKNASVALSILENPGKLLSMVLIGNNLVNISASALMTVFVTKKYGSAAVGIGTGILTLLVLLFGEVVPKTAATADPEKLAMRYAPVLRILTIVFTPLVFILNILAAGVLRIMGIDRNPANSLITEEELISYVDVSHEEGVIESEEREMINNVLDFGDAQAKDVMIPRMEMQAVEDTITYADLMNEFQENKFSRLPVYAESVDNIIGIIYLKDICFYHGNKEAFKVGAMVRPAHFTYEFKKASELLIEMRKESTSMCVVLDEYGAVAGIITLEDLLEEIVGDIRDEYDENEEADIALIREGDGFQEYEIRGTTRLDDFNDYFGTEYESNDYDSVAGLLIDHLEHLPKERESVEFDGMRFTIVHMDGRRINRVHLRRTRTED